MFGKRLKALREAKGLTQEELAKAIGVSQGTIARYESGLRKSPRIEVVLKLAQFFGVSTDYLLGINEQKKKADSST